MKDRSQITAPMLVSRFILTKKQNLDLSCQTKGLSEMGTRPRKYSNWLDQGVAGNRPMNTSESMILLQDEFAHTTT